MIHESAIVDPSARLHESVEVGPWTLIGPGVEIGEGTKIESHVVVKALLESAPEITFTSSLR